MGAQTRRKWGDCSRVGQANKAEGSGEASVFSVVCRHVLSSFYSRGPASFLALAASFLALASGLSAKSSTECMMFVEAKREGLFAHGGGCHQWFFARPMPHFQFPWC